HDLSSECLPLKAIPDRPEPVPRPIPTSDLIAPPACWTGLALPPAERPAYIYNPLARCLDICLNYTPSIDHTRASGP
ncbi:MAG: hypothetical protein LC647_07920, partial [Beggiatoa sp.]|nr:hypothetical protein [Beggiatoa sp.]